MFFDLQNIAQLSLGMDFWFGVSKNFFHIAEAAPWGENDRIFYLNSTLHFEKSDKNCFLLQYNPTGVSYDPVIATNRFLCTQRTF